MTQMPLENSSGLSHINTRSTLPIQFFAHEQSREFTRRKGFRVRDSFEDVLYSSADFDTYVDIHTFFQSRLSSLSMQGSTQDVQLPWPSASDLDSLSITHLVYCLRRHF